ncbi:rRNA maturation RNase YbeY [Mycoplasma sp. Ms02]|nr:rRNA maturation RNase YbeY [Mycoplasma sp. Ms02]QZE12689.1 rRNA maturation RNase YbeY [Mycoplasma sp. Ms02]
MNSVLVNVENNTDYKFEWELETNQILSNLRNYFSFNQDLEVDLVIINNEEIRELNKVHRGKDYATDVLSFDLGDSEIYAKLPFRHLGELYISYEKILSQAEEFGHSPKREFCYLFTHGLVHLMGYDHEEESERKEMNKIVDEIFDPLKITRES